jgi:hypothetical protein
MGSTISSGNNNLPQKPTANNSNNTSGAAALAGVQSRNISECDMTDNTPIQPMETSARRAAITDGVDRGDYAQVVQAVAPQAIPPMQRDHFQTSEKPDNSSSRNSSLSTSSKRKNNSGGVDKLIVNNTNTVDTSNAVDVNLRTNQATYSVTTGDNSVSTKTKIHLTPEEKNGRPNPVRVDATIATQDDRLTEARLDASIQNKDGTASAAAGIVYKDEVGMAYVSGQIRNRQNTASGHFNAKIQTDGQAEANIGGTLRNKENTLEVSGNVHVGTDKTRVDVSARAELSAQETLRANANVGTDGYGANVSYEKRSKSGNSKFSTTLGVNNGDPYASVSQQGRIGKNGAYTLSGTVTPDVGTVSAAVGVKNENSAYGLTLSASQEWDTGRTDASVMVGGRWSF